MATSLLRPLILALLLCACGSGSRQLQRVAEQGDHPFREGAAPGPVSFPDTSDIALPDSTWASPQSLLTLPLSEDGQTILSEGYYESEFKSYCLQPGAPDPADRDAYYQGPLNSYRQDIVETILRNSLKKPSIDQRNIQLLLWSVVSGSDFRKLSWEVQGTAKELLSKKQVFAIKGGVMGVVRTVSDNLPADGATLKMKEMFDLGTSSYDLFERVAVPRQPSNIHRPEIKRDQWYRQPQGYYLRYFPGGYQKVKVQVYVPAGLLDNKGKHNGEYLLFDPVTLMAIPANSNAQRLGIGAPMVEVIRKIIKISSEHPAPHKDPPQKDPPVLPGKKAAGS